MDLGDGYASDVVVKLMTVKELKERLNQFPDNLIIVVPNSDYDPCLNPIYYTPARKLSIGVNEDDGLLLIDDYMEDV